MNLIFEARYETRYFFAILLQKSFFSEEKGNRHIAKICATDSINFFTKTIILRANEKLLNCDSKLKAIISYINLT